MPSSRIRVLIADDSRIMRKLFQGMVVADRRIEVVDVATGGKECLAKTASLKPAVVLLDLTLPDLDAVAVTRTLMKEHPGLAVILICEHSHKNSAQLEEAVAAGAFDFFIKPKSTLDLDRYQRQITTKILVAGFARSKQVPSKTAREPGSVKLKEARVTARRYTIIGCSAGGCVDLAQLLPGFTETVETSLVIVVQEPPFAVGKLLKDVKDSTPLTLQIAKDDVMLAPAHAYLAASSDRDLVVSLSRKGCKLGFVPPGDPAGPHPNLDRLMESAAAELGKAACGVILSGAGGDGLRGLEAIREAFGLTIAVDLVSASVRDLPAQVAAAKLADETLPLSRIGLRLSGPVA